MKFDTLDVSWTFNPLFIDQDQSLRDHFVVSLVVTDRGGLERERERESHFTSDTGNFGG